LNVAERRIGRVPEDLCKKGGRNQTKKKRAFAKKTTN